ncbi:MAG: tRNA uridine-5-carboxymethylaminomethyl(34) synthesis enzyme MnmG [Lachnospiraceae bacterium]|jgi:tRNA uridine 5-carboxymethylaminomethyl modification enzyme|nr:tRNA uridine-5-carboxymethylaminomethyl(34) synthesis enzyme MnmG [Lachnospiraceae bacterium]MCH4063590.1 tRNA uridine-5-carboxymethylaminomethyl(34) synthesis enzyme MnmG [Lachnospiraceae bacterium]MCH4103686.1 tRNA uridine-5-carboxymethylaminomethyl(34) synthesis enzyme MnmG [Lachnospiraceae bacterium]
MPVITENYDVVIVGAGHAGCEAALACARMGLETIMFTVSVESIALMPCNPNIGGSSKGHLVRELDALGGEMGKNIDKTFIQSKMLNSSKGPAVHSLRAQADKAAYTMSMRHVLENQDHLTIRQQEVAELITTEDVDKLTEKERKIAFDTVLSTESTKYPVDLVDKSSNTDAELSPDAQSTCEYSANDSLKAEQSRENSENNDVDNSVSNVDKHHSRIIGVRSVSGAAYFAKAVVLCTGVYLKSRCIYGDVSNYTGPNGLMAANHLSASLRAHGVQLVRFKTGTPARIDKRSIDFSKMAEQKGDERVVPFSFSTDPASVQIEQESCWLTYTNEETHKIIRDNIDRSPLYSGVIHATGPRYCPSIEDKVVRFADKPRHQVFVEPEGKYTNEMYIDGMSSSMPEDVQFAMYRTVPGLEHARIVRNAYAIEYDCLAPKQLRSSLEFRNIDGLFSGGQFNGSSGYEEAAAQGIIAGINAAQYVKGKKPLVLKRSESYIGVLIDDLVTKENHEPYRMMTSRAEYRLLLRQDNADLRLRKYGYEVGLISEEQMDALRKKEKAIKEEIDRVKHQNIGTGDAVQDFLEAHGSTRLESGATLADLIRRPELSYELLAAIDPERPDLPDDVKEQVNIEIKYEGYIDRQKRQVAQFEKAEKRSIPEDIDYDDVKSLRLEARQKLKEFRPENVGQASRIAGVSPADISVLFVYLKQLAYRNRK